MMKYLVFVLALAGCTSVPVESDSQIDPKNIEMVDNGVIGTRSMLVPDITGFEELPPQRKRVSLDCAYEAKGDPNSSNAGKNQCEKEMGRLMLAKQFFLVGHDQSGAEHWLFRFEEKRKRFGAGSIESPIEKDNDSQMWGTLTRFKAGEKKPYSHVLVNGAESFKRAAWQAAIAKPRSSDSLMVILGKSLILKAVTDPIAGADQID